MKTYETYDLYIEAVMAQAARLQEITGLTWEYETTGGGCDALITTDSISGRMIMLTDCNAQVPLDVEIEMCVGLYSNPVDADYLDSYDAYDLAGVGRVITTMKVTGEIGRAPVSVCDIHCDESRMNKHGQCDECLDDAHEMEIIARG